MSLLRLQPYLSHFERNFTLLSKIFDDSGFKKVKKIIYIFFLIKKLLNIFFFKF